MSRATATWRSAIADAASALGDSLEARRLGEEASGLGGGDLFLALDRAPEPRSLARLAALVERRRAGEPLQHVLGHWSFRELELVVDGRALVPRPETEVVVGLALAELDRIGSERSRSVARRHGSSLALDLGTGSGAIACSLVHERDDLSVVGVDRSPEALALAEENRRRLGTRAASRLTLVEADWYAGLPEGDVGAVDCVVANPPYLATEEWAGLDAVVRDFDPYAALVAGPTGLEAVEAVVAGAPAVLAPGGSLVLELAPRQAAAAVRLALLAGADTAHVRDDLAGRPRVLVARWPGAR